MEYFTEKMEQQNENTNLQKSARNYKDSLFVDLFARCPEAKENFLSLYNALHGTDLKFAETKIEPVMLEKRYKEKMIKIPKPEFYVFYNGTKNYPSEKELCLSDAFFVNDKKRQKIPLELSIKVYNINKKEVSSILQNCPALRGYATLVQYADAAKSSGIRDCLTHAIQRCIKEGILVDYLKRNSTEVRNMLIADYDYDTDIRVKQQEAFEEGSEERAIETAFNFLKMGLSPEQVAQGTSLPLEKVLELQNNK